MAQQERACKGVHLGPHLEKAQSAPGRRPHVDTHLELEVVYQHQAPTPERSPRGGPLLSSRSSRTHHSMGSEAELAGLHRALACEQGRAAQYKQQLETVRRQHQADVAGLLGTLGESEKAMQSKVAHLTRGMADREQEVTGLRRALALEQGRSTQQKQALEAARREHATVVEALREQLYGAGRAKQEAAAAGRAAAAAREEAAELRMVLAGAQARTAQLEALLGGGGRGGGGGGSGSGVDTLGALRAAAAAELAGALDAADRRRQVEVAAMGRELAGLARELDAAQGQALALQGQLRERQAEVARLTAALASTEKQTAGEIRRLQGQLLDQELDLARLQGAGVMGDAEKQVQAAEAEAANGAKHTQKAHRAESVELAVSERVPARLAAVHAAAATELAAALKAAEARRHAEVAALGEQLAEVQAQAGQLQSTLGDREADLAGARKQGVEAVQALQAQVEQAVAGWLQEALSAQLAAAQSELGGGAGALRSQLAEAPGALPAVRIVVGAGRAPSTPSQSAEGAEHKAGACRPSPVSCEVLPTHS